MTEHLTAAQMRAIEQAAIDSGQVTGLELMERAGQGVVEAIFEEWPELKKTSYRAVVLCGPGNNGGDGFVVARLLKQWGWEVEVFLYGDAEKLPADARVNYERWVKAGELRSKNDVQQCLNKSDEAVDAILGCGLNRSGKGEISDFLRWWSLSYEPQHENAFKVVAIDVPSGVCSDSGRTLEHSKVADITVATGAYKPCHFLNSPMFFNGHLSLATIGISIWDDFGSARDQLSGMGPLTVLNNPSNWDQIVDVPPKDQGLGAHKFSHGHALICSGPATKTGAARLAARGALRIGAGLVTVASPTDALQENAAHLTAIMQREVNTAEVFKSLLSDDRISAICVGPGFARESESGGLDFDHTRQMVKAALSMGKKTVLDADALSAFESNPSDLFKHLHKNCVLTPHGGEFKRLFPDIHVKLNAPTTTGPAYSKVDATRDAANRAGCTVLFKGPDTVIANKQGRASINSAHYDRAAPWLATAGSGDVLAGFITGLLARGLEPMRAAEISAHLHVECALKFGPGLIAEDIPEQLPAVFRDLGH
jgi:hydroxyethylthiazole kinase-like uncharacterized protein yjeF